MIAVKAEGLTKIFGKIRAVDNLSFEVNEGEIYGLIGPNGAGKTTTLRIVATLLQPTYGTVKVFNYDVTKNPSQVRKLISYLPEEAGAYKQLNGWEYLKFIASFYADNESKIKSMIDEASRISGLEDRLKDRLKTYSKGMKRRILLARTLMVKPKLAILDEPTSGLDVQHALHIRRIIRRYSETYKTTILLSSHNMLEVEYLCHRVGIIDRGRLIEEGSPRELKDKYSAENLEEVFMEATKNA